MAQVDEAEPDQPAAAVGRVGAPPVDGIVEPGTSGAEPGAASPESADESAGESAGEQAGDLPGEAAPAIAHVPVKKKGSRKR